MREISEKEFQELTNSYSIKSEYQKLIGKDVTPERFLFCCYEVTKHLKETDMNFRNKNLWPELQNGACPEGEIENAIDSLTKWYAENLPQLTKKKPVDFESMWHICVDLAHLEKDFSDLVGRHTDEVLEDHLLDEDELAGVWIALKESLTKNLGNISKRAWAYYNWAYGITPPKQEINISEVPPVGRYARNRTGGDRQGRGNKRGNDRQGRGNDRQARGKQGGRHSGKRDDRKQKGGRPNNKKRDNAVDKAKEKEVIQLVNAALKSLGDGSTDHVTLAPQNSFFRRIQHKHANDQGFTTESIGEAKDRAVKIFKK